MFGLIKKIFVGLLTGIVSASNHANCVSLSNQKSISQPIKLDICVGSCNTLNDLFN